MLAIDIVKPEPRTELEVFERWCNKMQSNCLAMIGKKIEVKSAVDVALDEIKKLSGLLNRRVITKAEFAKRQHLLNKEIAEAR
jgi:hypothetical protein